MAERNYKKEYKDFHSSSSDIAERSARNSRRNKAVKDGRAKKGDRKDLHHWVENGVIKTLIETMKKNRGRKDEGGRIKGKSHNKN
jgi:hypothetical protein